MDKPTIDGVNSYFVSKVAAQAGLKAAFSWLGGDELFGSYPSFSQIPSMVKMFGPVKDIAFLGKSFRVISATLIKNLTSPKYAGILEYGGSYGGAYLLRRGMFMPWELPKILDGEIVREDWQELQTLLRLEDCTGNRNQPFESLRDGDDVCATNFCANRLGKHGPFSAFSGDPRPVTRCITDASHHSHFL